MPRNGSGAYSPPAADYPVVSGTVIESAKYNDLVSDVATALTTSIASDGQTTPTANIPMGGFKITGLGLGTASTDAARVDNAAALNMCEFRLTLTTGTPVTTSDVSAAVTLFFTPYRGNCIALYDGSNWHRRTSGEMSIAYPAAAPGVNYDVFCFDNSGTPTLELLAWTNDTTRATALTKQDGVLVKTGAVTRRYVGTVRADSSSLGNDSLLVRHVWNYYNRVRRLFLITETTGSWNYNLTTPRRANANSANMVDLVIGVVEDPLVVETGAQVSNSAGNCDIATGFGYDSTSAFYTSGFGQSVFRNLTTANAIIVFFTTAKFYPTVGRHFITWLEASAATGVTTWRGQAGSGLQGEIAG